jgi:hypothetical protein
MATEVGTTVQLDGTPSAGINLDALAELVVGKLAERLRTESERLLDRPALAERLGISERAVSAMAARGDIPAGYLIGGVRRWDWTAVKKYLEARSSRRPRKGRGRYGNAEQRSAVGRSGAQARWRQDQDAAAGETLDVFNDTPAS